MPRRKSLHEIRPLRQKFFGRHGAGGDEFQIVAVKEQFVETVLLGDDAIHLVDHRRVDGAAHQSRESGRRRLDGAQHHIFLRIDAALGQQVAGHLIERGAKARYRDLLAALQILQRSDFFAGE